MKKIGNWIKENLTWKKLANRFAKCFMISFGIALAYVVAPFYEGASKLIFPASLIEYTKIMFVVAFALFFIGGKLPNLLDDRVVQ